MSNGIQINGDGADHDRTDGDRIDGDRADRARADGEQLIWDAGFPGGFTTTGPDARWWHWAQGPYAGDDGHVTASENGLRVVSSGTNFGTGEPAFVRTLAQDQDNELGLPGEIDHVKWLVYAQHRASSGVHGFDALRGQVLSFNSVISGRSYGTAAHLFGPEVLDPEDDLRLAAVGTPVLDFETCLGTSFFLTNRRVYIFYERLPFAREQLGNYAAFLYAIPVAERSPGDVHDCRVAYHRSAGTVRYFLQGEEVFRVDRLGHRLSCREHLMLDHGGEESLVEPRQFNSGMGLFTILDGALPGHTGSGLVRLSPRQGHYFGPVTGAPRPQTFFDDKSLEPHRLFGQGAELTVSRYRVHSAPAD